MAQTERLSKEDDKCNEQTEFSDQNGTNKDN